MSKYKEKAEQWIDQTFDYFLQKYGATACATLDIGSSSVQLDATAATVEAKCLGSIEFLFIIFKPRGE